MQTKLSLYLLKGSMALVLGIFPLLVSAQIGLEGSWTGTISQERPELEKDYKFELTIKKKGKKIEGIAYIYYDDQAPVAMDLSGRLFKDRSMRLFNYKVLFPNGKVNKKQHIRKYQLIYKRSAFYPDIIEGYWQEKNDPIFEKYRKGRVYLTKEKKPSKA